MNFPRFCENRYQELTLDQQTRDQFSCKTDCEIKAIHQLLSGYRTALKYLLIPKCIVDFALVKLGKRPEPEAVLINKAREDRQKKADAEAAKACDQEEYTEPHGFIDPGSADFM